MKQNYNILQNKLRSMEGKELEVSEGLTKEFSDLVLQLV